MKLSLWNSYLEVDNRVGIIYNSLSNRFIVIKELKQLTTIQTGSLDPLPKELVEQLIAAEALVPDEKDEPAELDEIIASVDENTSAFHLIVNPTLDCNFHCWYCYENHVKGSRMSDKVIASVNKLLDKTIRCSTDLKILDLSFFGGEPLLQFNNVVVPIIENAHELCSANGVILNIHFTSNAGLITNAIVEKLQNYKASFQITLDGGREHHDRTRFFKGGKPSFNVILGNIKKLLLHEMPVVLRINYTHKNIDSIKEIVEELRELNMESRSLLRIDLQQVWQDRDNDSNVTDVKSKIREIRADFRRAGFIVSNSYLLDYMRYSCYADKQNEVLVNYNGDIFSCTARDFTRDSRMGVLSADGNVIWNDGALERKMSCKFKKSKCRACRIAPICAGGCRIKSLENAHHDECNLGFDSQAIDDMILDRFEYYFLEN